jgi:hypothetical protein
MALTDYELKLRGRSWCNNLRQNGIIKDDITYQNCLSAFPMSSNLSQDPNSELNDEPILNIIPPSSNKLEYNYSLYDSNISAEDTTKNVNPNDNERFMIYNTEKRYITYNSNPFSQNFAKVDILADFNKNTDPETFEWTLINRGDNNYSIMGSNNKFLSINNNKEIIVSSTEINNFSLWKIHKIDNFVFWESVQFPNMWLASRNNDIYLSDDKFYNARWLMLNLSVSEKNINSVFDENNNTVVELINNKSIFDLQLATLIKNVMEMKIKHESLIEIKNNITSIIERIKTTFLAKIQQHNNNINQLARAKNTDIIGIISSNTINIINRNWNDYINQQLNNINKEIKNTEDNYNKYVELFEKKMTKYNNFLDKSSNFAINIKNKMNSNTQEIQQQIGDSNNMEKNNTNISSKLKKDNYIKTIAEVNSNNYNNLQDLEYKYIIVKFILSVIFLIIIIWLTQRAINLYYTNLA